MSVWKLALSTPVLQAATKGACALCACAALPLWLHWEEAEWTVWPAIVLMTPYLGYSIEKGVLRLFGTITAVFISFFLIDQFAQNWAVFAVWLAFIVGFLCYFAAGDRYPYFFTVAAFTTAIITIVSLLDPAMTWDLAKYRSQNTAIGCIIALTVMSIVWPVRAGDSLNALSRSLFRNAAAMVEICRKALQSGQPIDKVFRESRNRAISSLAQYRPLVYFAMRDTGPVRRYRQLYDHMGKTLGEVVMNCSSLANTLLLDRTPKIDEELLNEAVRCLWAYEELLRGFSKQPLNLNAQQLEELNTATNGLHQSWERYLNENRTLKLEPAEAASLGGIMDAILEIGKTLNLAWEAQQTLQEGDSRKVASLQSGQILRNRMGIKRPFDTMQLRKGLQAGASVLLGLLFYYYTAPPGMAAVWELAVVMGCINATQPIFPVSKAVLGTLLGAAGASILLYGVYQHVEIYLPILILTLFPVSFIGYVISQLPGHTLTGLLYNLMLITVIVTGPRPDFDAANWYTVILSMTLAILVTGLAVRLVWPIMPAKECHQAIARFFSEASVMLAFWQANHPSKPENQPYLPQMQDALGAALSKAWQWNGIADWKHQPGFSAEQMHELMLNIEGLSLRYQAVEHARSRIENVHVFESILPVVLKIRQTLKDDFDALGRRFLGQATETVRPDFTELLNGIDAAMLSLREKRRLEHFQVKAGDAHHYLSVIDRYRDLLEVLTIVHEGLDQLVRPRFNQPTFT